MPAIICLGAEHGAAKQEILTLEWRDIDFDFQGVGLIRFYRIKNSRERTEFMMPRTREALLKWKDHLDWKRHRTKTTVIKSDHVFCRVDGTPLKNFSKAWKSCLDFAEIKDFHFHDLRHTFCSNLIMAGGGLKDAKEMIGHSDISMTDRYSHLNVINLTDWLISKMETTAPVLKISRVLSPGSYRFNSFHYNFMDIRYHARQSF